MAKVRRRRWSTARPVMWKARKGAQVLYYGTRPGPALRHVGTGVIVTRNGTVVSPPSDELPLD